MTRPPTDTVCAEIQRRAPGTTVRLRSRGESTVVIQLISVPLSQRGYGLGQRVLNILCAWADDAGLTLALSPSSHLGSDLRRLVAWYGRAGFTPSSAVTGQSMRRLPGGQSDARSAA